MLQKHSVDLPDVATSIASFYVPSYVSELEQANSPESVRLWFAQPGLELQPSNVTIDEMWQATNQATASNDPIIWDNIFSALDSQTL